MTQYVTREEYNELIARLDRVVNAKPITVNISASPTDEVRIKAIVREGIAQAVDNHRRGGFGLR